VTYELQVALFTQLASHNSLWSRLQKYSFSLFGFLGCFDFTCMFFLIFFYHYVFYVLLLMICIKMVPSVFFCFVYVYSSSHIFLSFSFHTYSCLCSMKYAVCSMKEVTNYIAVMQ